MRPYYISMSSLEEDKRLHSIDYLLRSCALVKALGGRRVIFHSGSCGKQSREAALEKALDTMKRAVKACDEAGYGDCILCPETMGKVNQLGTLDEVLALCAVDSRITPCIDFGHLYARSCGTQFAEATAAADYAALLDTLAERLGDDRAVHFHAHFSRIAYTKGGEKMPPDLCGYRVRPASSSAFAAAEGARSGPPRSSVSRPAHRPRTPPRWPKAMRRCKFGKKYQISRKNICTGLAKLLSIL